MSLTITRYNQLKKSKIRERRKLTVELSEKQPSPSGFEYTLPHGVHSHFQTPLISTKQIILSLMTNPNPNPKNQTGPKGNILATICCS